MDVSTNRSLAFLPSTVERGWSWRHEILVGTTSPVPVDTLLAVSTRGDAMKRSALCLLTTAALAVLVGCGNDGPGVTATSAGGPTSSPSPSGSPSITEQQATDLAAASEIGAGADTILGASARRTQTITVPDQPDEICRFGWKPRLVLAGSTTAWILGSDQAVQRVAVYQHPDAPTVMAESRSDSSRCSPSIGDNGPLGKGTFDNHQEITLPQYPRTADEFGYCDRFTVTADIAVWYTCGALLTERSGYVVTELMIQSHSLAVARSDLNSISALVADRLAALPTV
jgi:hypothetical protein